MKKIHVTSGSPYENHIGFSRAVRIGNTIAVAGTAPIAPDGSTAFPGDIYLQSKRCLEIISKAIEDAGGNIDNIIRTRIYVTDMSLWEGAAKAHGEYFGGVRPACTFVEVKGLMRNDWLVEMEADCIIPDYGTENS